MANASTTDYGTPSDGSTVLTPRQIEWAKQHDWFLGARSNDTVVVEDCYILNGTSYRTSMIWTGTFAELRGWAGY